MQNLGFVDVPDPRALIASSSGELWLPISESPLLNKLTQTVSCGGVYFDVTGYSEVREALLLQPIVIDGAAAYLEEEVEAYTAQQ